MFHNTISVLRQSYGGTMKMTEKRFNFVGGYLYDGNKPIGHVEDIKFRQDFEDIVNNLHNENETIKQTIQEAYKTERTALGKSVLKQLLETIQ